MKNLVKYLLLAALATGIVACSKSDTEGPPPSDTHSSVRVTHTNIRYAAPQFGGSTASGTISWGDGSRDTYVPQLVHDYSDASTFTVVCEMRHADRVHFSDLAGIERIDLSKF